MSWILVYLIITSDGGVGYQIVKDGFPTEATCEKEKSRLENTQDWILKCVPRNPIRN